MATLWDLVLEKSRATRSLKSSIIVDMFLSSPSLQSIDELDSVSRS